MDEKYEEIYHELEEKHWWFTGRRDIINSLVSEYKKNIKILDIGCSSGALLLDLQDRGFKNVFGVDISKKAVEACKKKGLENVRVMSAESLDFKEKFDLIIMSDVLEHIQNDRKAILKAKGVLKKTGKIICFVPAFMFLWSNHDRLNKHFRRHTLKGLSNLFISQGFRILRNSYWNFSLFMPILLGKKISDRMPNNKRGTGSLQSHGNVINTLLSNVLKFENFLLKGFNFPFGVSVFVVAEKK